MKDTPWLLRLHDTSALNGNLAAQKQLKAEYDIGESTVKQQYLQGVKDSNESSGPVLVEIDALPATKRGRKPVVIHQAATQHWL